jgi:hypothetical protein
VELLDPELELELEQEQEQEQEQDLEQDLEPEPEQKSKKCELNKLSLIKLLKKIPLEKGKLEQQR